MDRDDDTDWALLARWLADECTPADRAALERWVAEDPSRGEEMAALRRTWDRAAELPAPSRVDAMWNRLAARMHPATGAAGAQRNGAAEPPPASAASAPRRPTPVIALLPHRTPAQRRWRAAVAIAAGIVVVAGALATLDRSAPAPKVAAEPPLKEFATAPGQRATIRLADGTRVELGFASRLRVRPFETGRREMTLEGEAVFDVVHDAARPFLVHAANAVTEDLGTSFSIRAYPEDGSVRVVVMSGRVALRPHAPGAGSREAVLGPGELGRLDSAGRIEVRSRVDTTEYLGWLSGRVVFDNARLDAVAAELARRFDVAIRIPDPAVAARRVTVDMPSRTLAEVLDAALVPLALRSRRDGSTIVLERR
jgi:transmembrane sensor